MVESGVQEFCAEQVLHGGYLSDSALAVQDLFQCRKDGFVDSRINGIGAGIDRSNKLQHPVAWLLTMDIENIVELVSSDPETKL